MPVWSRRIFAFATAAALLTTAASQPASAQAGSPDSSAVVLIIGAEPTVLVPILVAGSGLQNQDLVDQLFLHLAALGPTLNTYGDKGFEPRLARSWTRRDSVTLVFDLDPRARWHDGAPVTARDVVFTYDRARDRNVSPILATLLREIVSVTAEGERRVVFKFARRYQEQLYDAVYHVHILPEHLVGAMPHDKLATSEFARSPVGSGPYKWGRRVAGEYVELIANRGFFLGRPGIDRLVIRFAPAAEARLNLMLSGGADAYDNIVPPLANLERVKADPRLRVIPSPTFSVGYILFNQRDRADTARPHPILADREVRRALVMGLDREAVVQAVYGYFGKVPTGPASQLLATGVQAPAPLRYNPGAARGALAARGWADHDADGILDRDGKPLRLVLSIPSTSPVRQLVAQVAERQWRSIGVQVEIVSTDFPSFLDRHTRGDFDMEIASAIQDPSPSGLVQSWSCAGAGGGNAAHYCNPRVDSLLGAARFGTGDPRPLWREVLRTIEDDAPAAFVYAPSFATVVARRFGRVRIRPESWWSSVWEWSAGPAERGGR